MGRSRKKSTPNVDVAPAVTPASKPAKKGKREAEESLEKIVNAKKQKTGEVVKQVAQKKKTEVKTQKKKKVESSSSDDPKEEQEVKTVTKKVVKEIEPPINESNSEELSPDDEQPAKPAIPLKKQQVAAKNGSIASAKKGNRDSSRLDSSDDECEEDEDPKSKKLPAASNGQQKKEELSDESDETYSDDEAGATAKVAKKVPDVTAKNKVDSRDSSDESSEDGKAVLAKAPVTRTVGANTKSKAESSDNSEESNSDESSEDEDADEEMVDTETPNTTSNQSDLIRKIPKTPATASEGSKTLFVGNLPYQVEQADVECFFQGVGEVVDVRLAFDADQRFKGFGHVEFATAEAAQKALELNGQSLNDRELRLDLARERGDRGSYTPSSGKDNTNSFRKCERSQTQTIFVRGFDKSVGEDEIRSSLNEHFKSCGDIVRTSIPTEFGSGAIKGMAYLEFKDADGFYKALELSGSQLGDECLTVEEAKPKVDNRHSWSGGRGGGRDSGGRRGGRFGGRFGGGVGVEVEVEVEVEVVVVEEDVGPNKPSFTAPASGKKTTFRDD
ncbi:hypothetical protein K2173_009777 [Erythroxylum novogranatense]|uniref:RRM domain-containing protein n=1 Tax=Erythroxylum novogranatense TaxID=1862640 RepID=A0AAV8TUY1_9ROSI|nr:hypothetical protein K2173_009777 [Erythroxylum novogranatense]